MKNNMITNFDIKNLNNSSNLLEEVIKDGARKMLQAAIENEIISKFSTDKQAKIGCKGKSKYWYGYKQHTSVDMQTELINKVAVTPANVTDSSGFKHACPSQSLLSR